LKVLIFCVSQAFEAFPVARSSKSALQGRIAPKPFAPHGVYSFEIQNHSI